MSAATARKLTRREELGVESRRKILDAAASLMAERGFAGTSISAVSKRSGLPSGSIYWHFESKEALLGAVVEDGVEQWLETMPDVRRLPDATPERIDAVFDATAASLETHPQFLRLLILIALERRETDAASLASIRRARARARERIQAFVVAVVEPLLGERAESVAAEFAAFAMCVADGAFIAHHIDPETTDLRATLGVLNHTLTSLAREAAR